MLVIEFKGNRRVEIVDCPLPAPKPGEVLLKIGASAICGSEMKHYRHVDGPPELVDWTGTLRKNPGHELTGTVVESAAACGPRVGDRVAVNIITGCGECTYCRRGDRRFCRQQGFVFGAHAEYIAVPAYTCMPLPDDIPFDLGVLLGGDTLGVAFHAFNLVRPAAGDQVAVIGAGPVGLGFLAMLKHLAVETILVEVSSYRRELAASMGVAHCFDPNTTDVLAEVRNLTSGEGADTVIDASGTDVGVNLGLSLTRRQGRFIFAGAGRSAHINPWAHFLEKELTAYGVWYFTDVDYFGILDAYRKGLDVAPLLTHRFALNQAAEAYRLMDEAMTGKAVFVS